MRRAVAIALLVAFSGGSAGGERARAVKGDPDRAPSLGPRRALVTVEFFCDWLNPTCRQAHLALAELVRRHPTTMRVVYRQLAWTSNPYASTHAEVLLEAAAQGRFFALVEQAHALKPDERRDLKALARRGGLDPEALAAAIADGRHRAQREQDRVLAHRYDVAIMGAPIGVWNGKVVRTPVTVDAFDKAYQEAEQRARALLAAGVPEKRLYEALLRDASRERAEAARSRPVRATGERPGDDRPADVQGGPRVNVPIAGAPARGPDAAEVVIVVFLDFQCTYCKQLVKTLAQIQEAYPGRVRLVVKHSPVEDHRDSALAARAAACAQLQGRFWEYQALLWQYSYRLQRPILEELARRAGLDVQQFAQDLDAGRCDARVDEDVADARALGIYGTTPVLYLNGLKLIGDRAFSELRVIVDEELAPGLLGAVTE